MFYLGHFFKYSLHKKTVFILFAISSLAFFALSSGWSNAQKIFDKKMATAITADYFTVLINSNEPLASYQRKLAGLPGIEKVEISSAEQVKSQVEQAITELGELAPKNINLSNYQALTIYIAKNISQKSYKLIREYSVRLLGEDKVTLSNLVKSKASASSKNLNTMYLVLGAITLTWLFALTIFGKGFASYCYLVEQYQRRKNIMLKSMFSGIGVFFLLGMISYLKGPINVQMSAFALVFSSLILLIIAKRARWN